MCCVGVSVYVMPSSSPITHKGGTDGKRRFPPLNKVPCPFNAMEDCSARILSVAGCGGAGDSCVGAYAFSGPGCVCRAGRNKASSGSSSRLSGMCENSIRQSDAQHIRINARTTVLLFIHLFTRINPYTYNQGYTRIQHIETCRYAHAA